MTAKMPAHGHLQGTNIILDIGETTLVILQQAVMILVLSIHGPQTALTTGILTPINGLPTMNVRLTARTEIGNGRTRTKDLGILDGQGGRRREILIIILESGGVTMAGKADDDQSLMRAPFSRAI